MASAAPMSLDITVSEHEFQTREIPHTRPLSSLLSSSVRVETHPLSKKPEVKKVAKKVVAEPTPAINPEDDPLRAMMDDPLAALARMLLYSSAPTATPETNTTTDHDDYQINTDPEQHPGPSPQASTDPRESLLYSLQRHFEFWNEKTPQILDRYTTSASIAVDNTFLNNDNDSITQLQQSISAENQAAAAASSGKKKDQAASRLEEMENSTGTSSAAMSYMSQKDFIKRVEEQHTVLLDAWNKGERVVALRVAIQCAKLLADMTIPQFYPSMFVILTRILDTFGNLVFSRIKERGIEELDPSTKEIIYHSLPATFKASDVCINAKETCKNWFFKTTCIRELLPRLYIDMSLLKSYRFLEDESFSDNLLRVCRQVRGVGDPLTASFVRAYVATKALDISNSFLDHTPTQNERHHVAPVYRKCIEEALNDWFLQHDFLKETKCENIPIVKNGTISPQQYYDLMYPSIEWLFQVYYFTEQNSQVFGDLLQQRVGTNVDNIVILKALILAFPPDATITHVNSVLRVLHTMLEPIRKQYGVWAERVAQERKKQAASQQTKRRQRPVDDVDDDAGDDADAADDVDDDDNDQDDDDTIILTLPPDNVDSSSTQSGFTPIQFTPSYKEFITLNRFVEEYATSIFAIICKKLITTTPQKDLHGNIIAGSVPQPREINLTSSLLNALWLGICDCPYIEFVNQHSPTLALMICIHGRWSDTNILLKNALQTLQKRHSVLRGGSSSLRTATGASAAATAAAAAAGSSNEKQLVAQLSNTLSSVHNIFSMSPHLMQLLTSDSTLRILDTLERHERIDLARVLLQRYAQYCTTYQDENRTVFTTNDSVLIHTLQELCACVHLSLSAISSKDDRNQVAQLCAAIILSIDYGKDVEAQLAAYVSFRQMMSEVPSTLSLLVLQANRLVSYIADETNGSKKAGAAVRQRASRKVTNFIKATIAFCHITIPSLPHANNDQVYERLGLFLETARTAIANDLLPQAEALLTAAIQQLSLLTTNAQVTDTTVNATGSSAPLKHMTKAEMSLLVTAVIKTILGAISLLPPIGGQWLRILGILLNVFEQDSCPCVDLAAKIAAYITSLSVVAVMRQRSTKNDSSVTSPAETDAINAATRMIIDKFVLNVKYFYILGGGVVQGLTKEQNEIVSQLLDQQQSKPPPSQTACLIVGWCCSFYDVLKLDAYTATILFCFMTSAFNLLPSDRYIINTTRYMATSAQEQAVELKKQGLNAKVSRDFAKKLSQLLPQ